MKTGPSGSIRWATMSGASTTRWRPTAIQPLWAARKPRANAWRNSLARMHKSRSSGSALTPTAANVSITCAAGACSSWATQPRSSTPLARAAAIPACRTPTTWPGSLAACCKAVPRRACWRATTRSVTKPPRKTSWSPIARGAFCARRAAWNACCAPPPSPWPSATLLRVSSSTPGAWRWPIAIPNPVSARRTPASRRKTSPCAGPTAVPVCSMN